MKLGCTRYEHLKQTWDGIKFSVQYKLFFTLCPHDFEYHAQANLLQLLKKNV